MFYRTSYTASMLLYLIIAYFVRWHISYAAEKFIITKSKERKKEGVLCF